MVVKPSLGIVCCILVTEDSTRLFAQNRRVHILMQRRLVVLVYLAKFIRIKAFYHSLKRKRIPFLNKHKEIKAAGRDACYTIIKMINDVYF